MNSFYQKATWVLLGLIITLAGSYVGFVIKNNEKEHQEMKQTIKDMRKEINEMWTYF